MKKKKNPEVFASTSFFFYNRAYTLKKSRKRHNVGDEELGVFASCVRRCSWAMQSRFAVYSRRLLLVVVAKGGENHLFLGWCLFMCSAKWSERANERSQMRHLNGFWPVCLR